MGMSRAEITRKLDEIVDFSGCERYLDTPVKRYSSGMTVRLGFAIAAHLEPEILVVDEVLAVGDAEFQKKAIGKMQDVSRGEGRTVLFVSHNMGAVKNLCKRGVVLDQGQVAFDGHVDDAIGCYKKSILVSSDLSCEWIAKKTDFNKKIELRAASLTGVDGQIQNTFSCDENIMCTLFLNVKEKVPGVYGWFCILDEATRSQIWVSDSNDVSPNKLETLPLGDCTISLTIPKRSIAPGKYIIAINFSSIFNTSDFYIDKIGEILSFEVHDYTTNRGDKRLGNFSTLIDWKF